MPEATSTPPSQGDPPPAPPSGPLDGLSLTPELIRATPEYQALQAQNRELARDAGAARSQAAEARQQAELARQTAEAQRAAAQVAEIERTLGTDGVAAWTEFSELSATDPVAAARKWHEFTTRRAQSLAAAGSSTPPAAGSPPATPPPPASSAPPPPPAAGLEQPLGQPVVGEDWNAIANEAEQAYKDVAKRNLSHGRVTMRDRAGAFMSFIAASSIRGGARPKS